jgi:hypothetical protein
MAVSTEPPTTSVPTVTDEEAHRQLKRYFEQTRSLPQLLATLRSRRVAMGYSIESGREETSANGRRLYQPEVPLAFVS